MADPVPVHHVGAHRHHDLGKAGPHHARRACRAPARRGRARTWPRRRARRCSCASWAAMASFMRSALKCGGSSAAAEARRPLGGERRDALSVVGGAPELALVIALDVELLGECAPKALVDGLLGARDAARGRGGEVPRQVVDEAGKFSVLDAAPDQAPVARPAAPRACRRAAQGRARAPCPPGAAGTRCRRSPAPGRAWRTPARTSPNAPQ